MTWQPHENYVGELNAWHIEIFVTVNMNFVYGVGIIFVAEIYILNMMFPTTNIAEKSMTFKAIIIIVFWSCHDFYVIHW